MWLTQQKFLLAECTIRNARFTYLVTYLQYSADFGWRTFIRSIKASYGPSDSSKVFLSFFTDTVYLSPCGHLTRN